MSLKEPTKAELILFPASTVLACFVAFNAASVSVPLAQAWIVLVGVHQVAQWALMANYVTTVKPADEPEKELPQFTRINPPLIVDGVVFQSASVAANLEQHDKRWRQFGAAVCNGQPMTQSKWTGSGRPFSRPEFENRMSDWLGKQIVAPKNRKSNGGGFKPNGAQGWTYFKGLADGREWLPLPRQD